jgi:hypothetical protein
LASSFPALFDYMLVSAHYSQAPLELYWGAYLPTALLHRCQDGGFSHCGQSRKQGAIMVGNHCVSRYNNRVPCQHTERMHKTERRILTVLIARVFIKGSCIHTVNIMTACGGTNRRIEPSIKAPI